MRPSFSPRRITIDNVTGARVFDKNAEENNGDTALRRLSFCSSTNKSGLGLPPRTPIKPNQKSSIPPLHIGKVETTAAVEGSSTTDRALQALQSFIYGIIVAIVMCPCMIGYCTIVYGDPAFADAMPTLVKLFFVSCLVHQTVILIFAPINFAIGQVQDAGLLFLSAIATSVVNDTSIPEADRIPTVVVLLSVFTLMTGVALIITGKLNLASIVHYLPMPVIGGYLGYIGLFTFQAGLALMTSTHLTGIPSWSIILFDLEKLCHIVPGIICGVSLLLLSKRYSHFAVLPSALLAMPAIFYIVLFISGWTLSDARKNGWVGHTSTPVSYEHTWDYFDFEKVHWHAMIKQLPMWFSMYLVIAFSSSLDIAAIIMGTATPMDYNKQLQTVGISNLFSGLCGGYTGSYIFSQTLFTYRTKTNSRVVGLALVMCEVLIVFIPISIVAYLPLYFFGSVMVFIGVDLMSTWLVSVYYKVLFREYIVLTLTFASTNIYGPQGGMAIGIVFAAFNFILEYSTVTVVERVSKTSNVVRNVEKHDLLSPLHSCIVTMELRGHIFFGSSIRILKAVKSVVNVSSTTTLKNNGELQPLLSSPPGSLQKLDGGTTTTATSPVVSNAEVATRYLIFDFKNVSGMDATAARSCFLTLKMLLTEHRIEIVYTGMLEEINFLLHASDVLDSDSEFCYTFSDLDQGLEFCEDRIIQDQIAIRDDSSVLRVSLGSSLATTRNNSASLVSVFKSLLRLPETFTGLNRLSDYFELIEYPRSGQVIFELNGDSIYQYVLYRGEVTLCTKSRVPVKECAEVHNLERRNDLMLRRVYPGCIFGDLDFYLQQPHTLAATVSSATGASVYRISRDSLARMEQQSPRLALMFQQAVLRASYMSTSDVLPSLVV